MRVLKVTISGTHLRFLFFCGTVHFISHDEWKDRMRAAYYEQHKLLLLRRENPSSDRIVFSQLTN